MGWMVGSPPPPDKLIRFADGSFARFPRTRWSYSHMRQLMPTSVVARGDDSSLRRCRATSSADLDAVTFQPLGRTGSMTWARVAARQLHRRHRRPAPGPNRLRALLRRARRRSASTSRSRSPSRSSRRSRRRSCTRACSTSRRTVPTYVPELEASGYADATMRQLLDMTTGMQYVEDYADENSSVWAVQPRRQLPPASCRLPGPRNLLQLSSRRCTRSRRTASASPTRPSTPTRSAGCCAA